LPIGEQIDGDALFEIDKQRAIPFSTTVRPFIYAQNPWSRSRWSRSSTQEPQEGHPIAWQAQAGTQAGPRSSTQGKAQFSEDLGTAGRSSGVHAGQFREALSKNLAGAGDIVTKEATHLDQEAQSLSTTGKLLKPALIPAMHPMGGLLAERARRFQYFHRERKGNQAWSDLDLLNAVLRQLK
jgi:hypothetical protein